MLSICCDKRRQITLRYYFSLIGLANIGTFGDILYSVWGIWGNERCLTVQMGEQNVATLRGYQTTDAFTL